ncbi:hypothetical protein LZ30DRAFT_438564 [Colletotrichum cereale]|nr:hypothetical protein LZ30DRAFT_438564 [Colletotrichum cereale]
MKRMTKNKEAYELSYELRYVLIYARTRRGTRAEALEIVNLGYQTPADGMTLLGNSLHPTNPLLLFYLILSINGHSARRTPIWGCTSTLLLTISECISMQQKTLHIRHSSFVTWTAVPPLELAHATLAHFFVKPPFTRAILFAPVDRHIQRRATSNVGGLSEIRHFSLRSGSSSTPGRRC